MCIEFGREPGPGHGRQQGVGFELVLRFGLGFGLGFVLGFGLGVGFALGLGIGCETLAFVIFAFEFFDEAPGGAFFAVGADAGGKGEDAEEGVCGDVFNRGCGAVFGGRFGEVETGDLEAVEEQAGAARVNLVGGDALEDVADAELDGGAIFGVREVEVSGAGADGRRGPWGRRADGWCGGNSKILRCEGTGCRSGGRRCGCGGTGSWLRYLDVELK